MLHHLSKCLCGTAQKNLKLEKHFPCFLFKRIYVYQRPDIIVVLTFEDRENKIKHDIFTPTKFLVKSQAKCQCI